MGQTAEHTALPWKVVDRKGRGMTAIMGVLASTGTYDNFLAEMHSQDTQEEAEANAAFIVEAVNNHDRLASTVSLLMEALERATTAISDAHAQVEDTHDQLPYCQCLLNGPFVQAVEALRRGRKET